MAVVDTGDEVEEFISSAKVDKLMEMLRELRQEDPNIKSLVVSQFTSFLDIVEKPLTKGRKFFTHVGPMA